MDNTPEISSNLSFTFRKEERLCSQKVIDRLFAEGESFLAFPLKVVFLRSDLPAGYPVQAGFTVSKKSFKRAVKRNRIKRLMREAYRLHKHLLYRQLDNTQLAVFFIYVGKEILPYQKVEQAVLKAFSQIEKRLPKN